MSRKRTNGGNGVGRPIIHDLTGHQRNSIKLRVGRGERMSDIARTLGVDYFAVLRIKRSIS